MAKKFLRMKKIVLLAIVLAGFIVSATAQNKGKQDGGRLQALKIAYLTKNLELTPEEAQKFWPVYNNYELELRKTRQQMKGNDDGIELDEKVIAIRKKYRDEFGKILSKEKANKVFSAEKEFSRYVQKEVQERKDKRQPQ